MTELMKFIPLILLTLATFVGCNDGSEETQQSAASSAVTQNTGSPERWYSQPQVERGNQVFSENCAVCHGDQAQGLTENWKQRLDDGSFPAPPLNGSAHAWHHSLALLTEVVEKGGTAFGGKMPPFADVLTDDDKQAAIAYFQSFWDEDTYLGWLDVGGVD